MCARSGWRSRSARWQAERHLPVGNTGLFELIPFCDEPMPLIERQSMGLRVQPEYLQSALPPLRDQKLEDGAADAASPPSAQHGHATDMAVRQQPSGADRPTRGIQRQRMQRQYIKLVPFECFGHALLQDEDLAAQ